MTGVLYSDRHLYDNKNLYDENIFALLFDQPSHRCLRPTSVLRAYTVYAF
jgi:hypothetical protein